jgi:hypothetical protein
VRLTYCRRSETHPASFCRSPHITNPADSTLKEIPLTILNDAIPIALGIFDKSLSDTVANAQTNAILQESALGLASESGPCSGHCDARTRTFRIRFAIIDWGMTG